mmetsp:Transcript_23907/g.38428  ORF Transcript_23907/g.38428 Transcript_23907/m.38428 type:complete len:91 (-) Transcript_23907:450-722(-)
MWIIKSTLSHLGIIVWGSCSSSTWKIHSAYSVSCRCWAFLVHAGIEDEAASTRAVAVAARFPTFFAALCYSPARHNGDASVVATDEENSF